LLQALEKVSDILAQERGNLTVEEQVQQLLQSLQHDSASVKATALQVTPPAFFPHSQVVDSATTRVNYMESGGSHTHPLSSSAL